MTIVLISILGIIVSCSSETKSDTPFSQFINPMADIGTLHNQALDAISKNDVPLDSLCQFTDCYVENEFALKSGNFTQTENISEKSLLIAKQIGLECCKSYNTRGTVESPTLDSIYKKLPIQCKPFVVKMMEVIESNELDNATVTTTFQKIDKAIQDSKQLSYEDKIGLWTCSAIAHASYMYNLPKIKTRAITAEGVVKADLGGAIGGFLTWKFWGKTACGLMFGPQGAVVSATREIVTNAIIGSGVHVISVGYL